MLYFFQHCIEGRMVFTPIIVQMRCGANPEKLSWTMASAWLRDNWTLQVGLGPSRGIWDQ